MARSLFAAAVLTALSSADAIDGTWIGASGGSWSDPTNWSTNPIIPNAVGDTAFFDATPTSKTISVNGNFTLSSVTFDSAAGYSLTGPGQSLTFAASTGNATITANNTNGNIGNTIGVPLLLNLPLIITNNATHTNANRSYILSFTGALSGNMPITVAGTVSFSGVNSSWFGPLTINNGTLVAASNTSLGSGSGSDADATTVNPSGTLVLTAANFVNERLNLNGGTLATSGSGSTISFSGPIAVNADSFLSRSNISQGPASPPSASLTGNISGSGNLTLSSGNFTMSGTNSLTGNLSITGGILTCTPSGSFLNAPHVLVSGGALVDSNPAGSAPFLNSFQPHQIQLTGGTLALAADLDPAPFLDPASTSGGIACNVANATIGNLKLLNFNNLPGGSALRIGSVSGGSIAANVSLIPDSITHTLRFGISSANGGRGLLAILPSISDVNATSTNVDVGPGSSTEFDAASTYSGITTINGSLSITNASALGAGTDSDADGTVVNSCGSLSASSGIVLAQEKITLNGGALKLSTNAEVHVTAPSFISGTFNGPITGSGDVIPDIGTVNLNGNNTFSGNVIIDGDATLNANSPTALGDSVGTTTVESGSTLNLYAPSNEAITASGGTVNIYAATTGPIIINAYSVIYGQLFVNSDTSSPITINAGNLVINHTCSSTITFNGGNAPQFNAVPTGPITVNGGNVVFFSVSPTGLTTINGGRVSFEIPGNYSINVAGGTANLIYNGYTGTYSGNMTIGGGNSTLTGNPTLTNDLQLSGNATLAPWAYIYINGNVTGAGDLFVQSSYSDPYLTVYGQLNFTGTFHTINGHVTFYGSKTFNLPLSFEGSSVFFGNPSTFHQPVAISAGNINLYGAQHFLAPVNVQAGTVYFNDAASVDGGLNVSGGTITFNAAATSAGNWSLSGGTITLAPAGTSKVNALTFAGSPSNWSGTLDLRKSKLILEPTAANKSATLANLQNQAATHAIMSSTLPANFAIAVLDNAVTQFSTFGGAAVDSNSLLLTPELLGDANIDGHVDLTDLSTILNNFGTTTPSWTSGNFDHAPTIDLTDLSDVLNNFGLSNPNASNSVLSTQSSALSTPEPTSLALLLTPLVWSFAFRRRRTPTRSNAS